MRNQLAALAVAMCITLSAASQERPTATTPHVRVIAGNSCGSGTICGTNADGAWVLTNAHVTGTQLGRSVTVDIVTPGTQTRYPGTTQHTGYSSTRMVDYSIVWVPTLACKTPMQLLRTEPKQTPFGTTGSPRCIWPQQTKPFNDPQKYGQDLITGIPNAIGGQSGSAIYDENRQAIALLTWTISGRCAGQTTHKLWLVATTGNADLAAPRPAGLSELQADAPRPVTEDAIQATMDSPIKDLPIWYAPEEDPTDPTPDPEPDKPCCCCCCKDVGETAIDWARLIALIQELIRLITQQNAKLAT